MLRDIPRRTSARRSSTPSGTHNFTLYLSGADLLEDETHGKLLSAGCDDALFGERDGVQFGEFDREASGFPEAVRSAMRSVRSAVPQVELVRIEPDELVSAAAIAERAGFSREYIRLLTNGERGPGGFPPPAMQIDGRTRLWRWPDVAGWLHRELGTAVDLDPTAANFASALNAALALRSYTAELSKPELHTLSALTDPPPAQNLPSRAA